MFESLQHKIIFFSPLDSGASKEAPAKKPNDHQTSKEQAAYIEELEKLNFELRQARRAAFNLLEDAVQSKEALRQTEQKYRAKLEQEVLEGTADLKKSQHQYVSLVENTPDVITRWNKYLKLLYANTAFADKMRSRLKDLYGKTYLEMGQPDHIAIAYMNSLRKVFETGKAIEHYNSFPAPDGEVFYYSRMVPEKNEKGEIETVLAIARDITELKKAEEELKKQHSILKQAEEIAEAGSWEYNVQTKEFLWSDGMYRLFEIKKGEQVSPEVYLEYAIKDDLPVAKRVVGAIRENFGPIEEAIRVTINDIQKIIQIRVAPLENEKGELEKVLGVDLDITASRQSAQKIAVLNRSLSATNKELNSLNAELKTFTNIAAGNYVETLRHLYINLEMIVTNDARNLSNSGRANLRRAQGAIQKMKLVTDDLIAFSKLHEIGGKEKDVDLNKILQESISDFTGKLNHPPMQINCDHLPSISGYPLLLPVLFHHLLDNAIKFRKSDKDHVIDISCQESVSGLDLNLGGEEKDMNYNIISISDNGVGFPQEEANKIFEMFYQLHEKGKYRGSGTGLAICKKIMEMHKGFITAEGVSDEGASFHCYFPAGGG